MRFVELPENRPSPLATQNAHREAKLGGKAVAQDILICLDKAFLQNEAKHFFKTSQADFGSQLAEGFGSTELNVAYHPTSAIA